MTKSMMERFAESEFQPVEHDGVVVHPMLRLSLEAGDRIIVRWIATRPNGLTQGLTLRLRNPKIQGARGYAGLLRIMGSDSPGKALWHDSAPDEVEVECVRVDDGAELWVSNRWRQKDGREDEWLNNYGMLIEPKGDSAWVLHCSDGNGEFSPGDLVVSIERVRKTQ